MKQPKKARLWLNPSRDIAAQYPAGQRAGPAFDDDQNVAIMFGAMTSCIAGLTMGKRSAR
jgi:hypothetical protein